MSNTTNLATIVILSFIATANALSFVFILCRRKLRSPSNLFIASLILADLSLTTSMTTHYIDNAGYNTGLYGTDFACGFSTYLELSFLGASTASILLIGFDQREAVYKMQLNNVDPRSAVKRILIGWVVSFVYGARIALQFVHSKFLNEQRLQYHNDDYSHNDQIDDSGNMTSTFHSPPEFCNLIYEDDANDIYFRVLDLVVLFVIPVIILVVIGHQILGKIRDKSISPEQRNERRRMIKARSIIGIVAFFVCWAPFYLTDIITDSRELVSGDDDNNDDGNDDREEDAQHTVRIIVNILANLHCMMKLILCTWMNKNFRQEVRDALGAMKEKFQNRIGPA